MQFLVGKKLVGLRKLKIKKYNHGFVIQSRSKLKLELRNVSRSMFVSFGNK